MKEINYGMINLFILIFIILFHYHIADLQELSGDDPFVVFFDLSIFILFFTFVLFLHWLNKNVISYIISDDKIIINPYYPHNKFILEELKRSGKFSDNVLTIDIKDLSEFRIEKKSVGFNFSFFINVNKNTKLILKISGIKEPKTVKDIIIKGSIFTNEINKKYFFKKVICFYQSSNNKDNYVLKK
ncbi:MAG: hypothetical protein ACTSQJ_17910 [Promethearchaeota archaeon]